MFTHRLLPRLALGSFPGGCLSLAGGLPGLFVTPLVDEAGAESLEAEHPFIVSSFPKNHGLGSSPLEDMLIPQEGTVSARSRLSQVRTMSQLYRTGCSAKDKTVNTSSETRRYYICLPRRALISARHSGRDQSRYSGCFIGSHVTRRTVVIRVMFTVRITGVVV